MPKDIGAEARATRNMLARNLERAGVTVADGDGISELAEKASGLVVPHGTVKDYPTSATTTIYPGDFVAVTRELTPTNAELRIAPNATLLDAVTLPDGRIIILFYQDETVKIKAARYSGGQIALGATEAIEDADDSARICRISDNEVAVMYRSGGFGYGRVVTYALLVPTISDPDAWCEVEPYNIAITQIYERTMLVSYCKPDEPGATASIVRTYDNNTLHHTSSVKFAEDCDVDEYVAAWSATTLKDGRAVVTWFKSHGEPVRYAVLRYTYGEPLVLDFDSSCVYQGSVSRTCAVAIGNDILFANAVARLADNLVSKTFLALERWNTSDTAYGATCDWYAKCGEIAYNSAAPSCVRAITLGNDETVITWLSDGQLYASVLQPNKGADGFSTAVPIGACEGEAIALNAKGYVPVLREREGGVYLSLYAVQEVVAPAYRQGIGTALNSAKQGDTCRVVTVVTSEEWK